MIGDHSIVIWDFSTREPKKTISAQNINTISFSLDGSFLAFGGAGTKISVYSFHQDKTVSWAAHSKTINFLLFTNDFLVSCAKDTTIRVWKHKTFENITQLQSHEDSVNHVAVTNGMLASAGLDKKVVSCRCLVIVYFLFIRLTLLDFVEHKYLASY